MSFTHIGLCLQLRQPQFDVMNFISNINTSHLTVLDIQAVVFQLQTSRQILVFFNQPFNFLIELLALNFVVGVDGPLEEVEIGTQFDFRVELLEKSFELLFEFGVR